MILRLAARRIMLVSHECTLSYSRGIVVVEQDYALLSFLLDGPVETVAFCPCFLETKIVLASELLPNHHCGQSMPCQKAASDPKRQHEGACRSPTHAHLKLAACCGELVPDLLST